MIVAVVIFGTAMISLLVWLLRQSAHETPWVPAGHAPELASQAVRRIQAMRVGLVVLVTVITSLFGLFISAYLMRMEYADWRPLPEPSLLWLNTGVLAACSVALQWAVVAARGGRLNSLRLMLLAGTVLSLLFVLGQYTVWRQLNAAGHYLIGNPASAFFFLLTALHVLHLLGGLVVLGRAGSRLLGGAAPPEVGPTVELCAVYWHFLLAVWVVLFALLSST